MHLAEFFRAVQAHPLYWAALSFFEGAQETVAIAVVEHHRRLDLDHVVERAIDRQQNAAALHGFDYRFGFLRRRFQCFPVLHQLNAKEKA